VKTQRYKQLELVARVTHKRAADAQRVAGASLQVLQNNELQLTQLIAYRKEYNARFLVDGGAGISAAQLAGYREFLSSLDNAISLQERVIEENGKQWVSNRSLWQKIHAHERALEKVVDRRKAEDIRSQEIDEQKLSDDRAILKGATGKN
jgi:flagellar FliJ protein